VPTQGVFVAVIRHRKLLLAERADGKGLNLIGGRVEEGETLKQAAVREAKEETGFDVRVIEQIGIGHRMLSEEGEVRDIARIYFVDVLDGELHTTDESAEFYWASPEELDTLNVVKRECPGYPEGRTYAMIKDVFDKAINRSSFMFKKENYGNREENCRHTTTYKEGRHACVYSIHCMEQTCYGGMNAVAEVCSHCEATITVNPLP